MIRNVLVVVAAISVVAFGPIATVRAQRSDNKTIITFSQPVEIPGRVLPAGTYTFKLVDSMTDRHIVQILNADASDIIATVMAIPNYRLTPTDKTVITFRETLADTPATLRGWFYPGNAAGQEFVYSKSRALQLAKATKTPVPAIAVDANDADAMKGAPIVAITPDEEEVPVAIAIETMPPPQYAALAARADSRRLPQTADLLPTAALVGFASLCIAFALLIVSQRPRAAAARVRSR